MNTPSVISCFSNLFSFLGMPGYVHSDKGPSFVSKELKDWLHSKGTAPRSRMKWTDRKVQWNSYENNHLSTQIKEFRNEILANSSSRYLAFNSFLNQYYDQ